MSLGVLNNISAVYAENALNNTQSSLSKTLQQLSTGSRINSGADDAAGLALINGLQANQTALTQSQTNAQEGVGLLQVADGALSQVTGLLNRAVTLATEVSNGTLNDPQRNAANQEYQSILAEIDNIGSTTTFNQQKVFGAGQVGIYAGDSSQSGASINNLSISSLSRSTLGDIGGTMSYTAGQSVFLNLSSASVNSQSRDTLGASTATSTLDVSYLRPDGSTASTNISVGSGTNYDNSISGMISAINNSGLGLTASFGTGSQAGLTGPAATQTGIVISGSVGISAPGTTGTGAHNVQVTIDTTAGVADSVTSSGAIADGSVGVATINYSAGGHGDLNGTDLTSQSDAQDALTALNSAISAVAAQDGYIGAQINTLNAVSSVMSTQQQNIMAAQNAIQATDYAAAASNMSKYQILSQTGISAVAQANSAQQEVLKLLQ